MSEERYFDWEQIYREIPAHELGWYYPDIDPDLESALVEHDVKSGSFLDIGAGSGFQAKALHSRGFSVTATDISSEAIQGIKDKPKEIVFLVDDILETNLTGTWAFAFDRGCFHVFSEEKRPRYVDNVAALVRANGLFFLKCFSDQQPDSENGPHIFSQEMISDLFSEKFDILSFTHTVYQGTRKVLPKALFVVMRRKE